MLSKVRWAVMRTALRTVGRMSTGVRLGCRHGFDSGLLFDHVYAAEAQGLTGLGRLLDRALLDSDTSRAIRARGTLLQQMLREEIAVRGGEVRVLDMASGPARYLLDLLVEDEPGGQLRVFCRDMAPTSRARGRRLARQRALADGSVSYERGDAFTPQPLAEGPAPDIIVVSGLYEFVPDDDLFHASLERLRALLAPDGTLLFTGLACPPQPGLVTEALTDGRGQRLRPVCRPVAEAEAWAMKAGFGADGLASRTEPSGLASVTRCRKR